MRERFDSNHRCAVVRKNTRRHRTGDGPHEVENLHAFKGSRRGFGCYGEAHRRRRPPFLKHLVGMLSDVGSGLRRLIRNTTKVSKPPGQPRLPCSVRTLLVNEDTPRGELLAQRNVFRTRTRRNQKTVLHGLIEQLLLGHRTRPGRNTCFGFVEVFRSFCALQEQTAVADPVFIPHRFVTEPIGIYALHQANRARPDRASENMGDRNVSIQRRINEANDERAKIDTAAVPSRTHVTDSRRNDVALGGQGYRLLRRDVNMLSAPRPLPFVQRN